MMNPKKHLFVKGIKQNMTLEAAAVYAGYSAATAKQAATRLMKDTSIIKALDGFVRPVFTKQAKIEKPKVEKPKPEPKKPVTYKMMIEKSALPDPEPIVEDEPLYFEETKTEPIKLLPKKPVQDMDSLSYLQSVYSDPCEEVEVRMNAAKAALPYEHGKVAEKGKKETKADEAKATAASGSKFGTLTNQMRPS